MGKKRVTIQDIAKRTGYSKTAVSFAFNSPSRISKKAVEKILEAAKELDYIPDPTARNFSLGRHMAIGFLVPQSTAVALANPYLVSVMRSIAAICEENGYMLTLIPPLHSSVTEAVKSATVDGIITMGLYMERSVVDILRRRNLSIVSIDGTNDEDIPSVSVDDRAAAELQMRKILEYGHRRIAVISLPQAAYSDQNERRIYLTERRMKGYCDALSQYSLQLSSIKVVQCNATFSSGYKAAEDIISSGSFTAIVSMSDIVALGAWRAIRDKGLRVPDDVSIIGFDGMDDYSSKELSTIVQSADDKGRMAANMLFSIINGEDAEPARSLCVPFSFREGKTLRAVLKKD